MPYRRALLLLLAAVGPALAIEATPDDAVPKPPFLAYLNADQRAAWFALQRERVALQERDELRDTVRELNRKLGVLAARKDCT